MTYQTIVYAQRADGVCVVTLNRPDRLNAASRQMYADLVQAVEQVRADAQARVLVLTGAPRPDGRPCFCAGIDLKERVAAGSAWHFESVVEAVDHRHWQVQGPGALLEQIESLPKPTIAAIDGVCTTFGLELALACDFRLAAETAQIGDLHVKSLGTVSGAGGPIKLTRLVGPAAAKELLMSGEPIDGREAFRIGLVNHVYPAGEVLEAALAFAGSLAQARPEALAVTKAIVDAAATMGPEPAMRYAQVARTLLGTTSPALVAGAIKRPATTE